MEVISFGVPNKMELPQYSIIVVVFGDPPGLLRQESGKFGHIFSRKWRDQVLDKFETIDFLVNLFFRQNWGLEESAQPVDQLLEGRLVRFSVSCVLSFTQFLGGSHLVD